MKKIAILLLLLFSLESIAQTYQEKFSVNIDIGYPMPDKNFFTYYKGILATNIGVNYNLTGNLYAGISFNTICTRQKKPEANAWYYMPALNLKYRQELPLRFFILPETGVGMSFMNLKSDVYNYKETQKGLNVYGKLALGCPISNLFDLMVYFRYDYIHLQEDEEFTKLEYFRNLHNTNFGISINVKL